MVRVVIAEDSPTVRALLVDVLGADPEIRIVGEARNGREALDLARRVRPDVITMDVHMPQMDGLQATREIMIQAPTPIVIVSSRADDPEMQLSLDALAAGALTVMGTPGHPGASDFEARCAQLRSMVVAMSQVKVVRRWPARGPAPPRSVERRSGGPVRLVAIAASTGGPAALRRLLSRLPRDFPVPILVVQHISPDFVGGLAHWLSANCALRVTVARDGAPLEAGRVYLAPDLHHLGVRRDGRILLAPDPPIDGFRPSASYLFDSVARVYGSAAVAVILTGMGRDGVAGLHAVHDSGGLVLAQDESTSVIYGMPREAAAAGVVDAVLPLDEIADRLATELASGEKR